MNLPLAVVVHPTDQETLCSANRAYICLSTKLMTEGSKDGNLNRSNKMPKYVPVLPLAEGLFSMYVFAQKLAWRRTLILPLTTSYPPTCIWPHQLSEALQSVLEHPGLGSCCFFQTGPCLSAQQSLKEI